MRAYARALPGEYSHLITPYPALRAREVPVLRWALIFLIVALVAGLLGFTGIQGIAGEIARVLFFVFLVLLLVSLIMGLAGGRKTLPPV
jgi:uncharacterized membrane protein YtjA (UPF0391 family)